ncbi:MAG: RNA 2'-phosphotransferase [Cyanobacteriota bacterium]
MLSSRTVVNLSKQIEKVLFNVVESDEFGFITIDELLEELNKHPAWEYIQYSDITDVVKSSPLKRLEISGNKIRLNRPLKTVSSAIFNNVMPPNTLYYGTSFVGISRIKTFGIRSYRDQYIKLYPDKRLIQVLVHRNSHIVYVEIDALKAYKDGINFVKGNLNTYLVEHIPPKYINKIT